MAKWLLAPSIFLNQGKENKIWVMLTSAPGALVKELKEETFTLKVSLFTLLKS
jgi:hypothetical protein